MKTEVWKSIIGYEGLYEISNLGRVKSVDRYFIRNGYNVFVRERILKTYKVHNYPAVKLCKEAKTKSFTIHRLVAVHFIPNPKNLDQVNHINADRGDFRIENLEWCTALENMRHANRMGLIKRRSGEECANAKTLINTENGRVYKTIKEAADDLKIKRSTLTHYILGSRKNKTPLIAA